MDPFEQVWESSRTNMFSWGYPASIWAGVGLLFVLSFVPRKFIRRTTKLLSVLGCSFLAFDWSRLAISETWCVRRQWADNNPSLMTETGWEALTIDGANLSLGPVLFGLQAFAILLSVMIFLYALRLLSAKQPQSSTEQPESPHPVKD